MDLNSVKVNMSWTSVISSQKHESYFSTLTDVIYLPSISILVAIAVGKLTNFAIAL